MPVKKIDAASKEARNPMTYENCIKDMRILSYPKTALVSKDAILKCLYWYGDKFHTTLGFADKETYLVSLELLEGSNIKREEMQIYLWKLERDMIDFQLRESIANQTRNIRDLLVAKAFSTHEVEEEPYGDVSDPVGFSPLISPYH